MSVQDNENKSALSRRDFLKLMGAAGTAIAFAPFVQWGNFMPNPSSVSLEKVPVILPDGNQASVHSFPTNHSEVITYPETEDEVLNEEAFRKWQFIRLDESMGGDKPAASAFRVYSMVCLHLWCLWKYWPQEGRKRGECPCHGSMYDADNGRSFAGPAALQAPPSNVLPNLNLEADAKGLLWILPPTFSPNANGVVGYGRFIK